MTIKQIIWGVVVFVLTLEVPVMAQMQEFSKKKLNLTGDFRYRFEQDWNSRFDDGTYRIDRFRMRFRLRFAFTYQVHKYVHFGGGVRTGVATNMQSPHINVGYNGFTSAPFNIDKAYIKGSYKWLWGWLGKNSFPFWKQNELFWDDDVNPEGVTIGGKFSKGNLKLNPTIGYYVTNHDQLVEYVDGTMIMAQIAGTHKINDKLTMDIAVAYNQMDNIFDIPEHLGGTKRINYKFIIVGARAKISQKRPLELGLDYFGNMEDYTNNPNIENHYKDQKNGFVGHIQVGNSTDKGDWLFGYYFAYKQKYSVVDYYGEDDWVRWGNVDRNRNTNYSGHEFRLAYTIAPGFIAMLRAYTVEAIVKRLENNAITTETGSRIRLDIDIEF